MQGVNFSDGDDGGDDDPNDLLQYGNARFRKARFRPQAQELHALYRVRKAPHAQLPLSPHGRRLSQCAL